MVLEMHQHNGQSKHCRYLGFATKYNEMGLQVFETPDPLIFIENIKLLYAPNRRKWFFAVQFIRIS